MAQARISLGQLEHANAFVIADLERYHPTFIKAGLLKIQPPLPPATRRTR